MSHRTLQVNLNKVDSWHTILILVIAIAILVVIAIMIEWFSK
jgi:hypothetical protein